MFIRFIAHWLGHEPGSTDDMEESLARRLISLGVAEVPPVGALKAEAVEEPKMEGDQSFLRIPKKRGRPPKVKAD